MATGRTAPRGTCRLRRRAAPSARSLPHRKRWPRHPRRSRARCGAALKKAAAAVADRPTVRRPAGRSFGRSRRSCLRTRSATHPAARLRRRAFRAMRPPHPSAMVAIAQCAQSDRRAIAAIRQIPDTPHTLGTPPPRSPEPHGSTIDSVPQPSPCLPQVTQIRATLGDTVGVGNATQARPSPSARRGGRARTAFDDRSARSPWGPRVAPRLAPVRHALRR
jgi:hypothetical protein